MKKTINFGSYYTIANLENEKWKVKYEKLYLRVKKIIKNISNYVLL